VAIVLALHNFPEGMSTFLAANEDLSAGIALAVAIAIHNIPEGVAVAAPIYAATKSRKKAFWWATLSGFAELAGGLFGVLLIGVLLPTAITGAVFGLVAGMMVFVAIDELLPAARRYQTRGHQVVYGLLGGMAVMAVSLLLL
jgi:ZIP family zinc transporter